MVSLGSTYKAIVRRIIPLMKICMPTAGFFMGAADTASWSVPGTVQDERKCIEPQKTTNDDDDDVAGEVAD